MEGIQHSHTPATAWTRHAGSSTLRRMPRVPSAGLELTDAELATAAMACRAMAHQEGKRARAMENPTRREPIREGRRRDPRHRTRAAAKTGAGDGAGYPHVPSGRRGTAPEDPRREPVTARSTLNRTGTQYAFRDVRWQGCAAVRSGRSTREALPDCARGPEPRGTVEGRRNVKSGSGGRLR